MNQESLVELLQPAIVGMITWGNDETRDKKEGIVMHVDMDHFFMAIEERENPELEGKPVVAGADL